jgi:hypothetical protein
LLPQEIAILKLIPTRLCCMSSQVEEEAIDHPGFGRERKWPQRRVSR